MSMTFNDNVNEKATDIKSTGKGDNSMLFNKEEVVIPAGHFMKKESTLWLRNSLLMML